MFSNQFKCLKNVLEILNSTTLKVLYVDTRTDKNIKQINNYIIKKYIVPNFSNMTDHISNIIKNIIAEVCYKRNLVNKKYLIKFKQ